MNNNNNNIYERPWGTYQTIDGNDNGPYKVKKIVVRPQGKLSLQSHQYRSEHWTIVSGQGMVQVGDNKICVQKDSQIYIPIGELHRIENSSSDVDLVFIEVQIGDYLGEDDIRRYNDIYGRN